MGPDLSPKKKLRSLGDGVRKSKGEDQKDSENLENMSKQAAVSEAGEWGGERASHHWAPRNPHRGLMPFGTGTIKKKDRPYISKKRRTLTTWHVGKGQTEVTPCARR